MARDAITLSADVALLARRRARAGGFAGLGDYVAALIRADIADDPQAQLAIALAEGERAPLLDYDMASILREAREPFADN